jgi:NADP-dependent 3-hydroxy acid dehydrogenase YdfG/acyl carrier protein
VCGRTAVRGLLKSLSQELPWLQCRHVDVDAVRYSAIDVAALVVREMDILAQDREVAYRDGERYVARLEPVSFSADARRPLPFERGGMYLVTGGLGGISATISKYLLERYNASLLLVGRSDVSGDTRADDRAAVHRKAVLTALARAGGRIAYETADVCDRNRIDVLVGHYESLWGRPLKGIVHLAGHYKECLLTEETPDGLLQMLAPKMAGTRVLHDVLERRGGGLFIASSSIAGFFGGASIGTYAAGNAVQDAFAEHHRERGVVEHYCFAWSTWDNVGQSRDYTSKDLPRSRGYQAMPADRALQSLLAGLAFREHGPLVGLDGTHRHIRRYLADGIDPLERAVLYYSTSDTAGEESAVGPPDLIDAFGATCAPELVWLPSLPTTATGDVDTVQLTAMARGGGRGGRRPATDQERTLADIWMRVLNVPEVSADDNFFDLGGDSLLAGRLLAEIRDAFHVDLSLRSIFDASNLEALALAIGPSESRNGSSGRSSALPVEDTMLVGIKRRGTAEVEAL